MQAQSANIQGVSGASYTSAGFAQSLQSALHTLGFMTGAAGASPARGTGRPSGSPPGGRDGHGRDHRRVPVAGRAPPGAPNSAGSSTARGPLLHHADEVFSTWQPDSPISRLRSGQITDAQAPAEVAEVLERCAAARELSGGWFDPWAMPGGIDPTGFVKGWAAQRALGAFAAEWHRGRARERGG